MKNRKIFEVVGLLSVIGSLLFVGIEINQNTTAVRGATQQAVSSQVAEMYRIVAENKRDCFFFSAFKKFNNSKLIKILISDLAKVNPE